MLNQKPNFNRDSNSNFDSNFDFVTRMKKNDDIRNSNNKIESTFACFASTAELLRPTKKLKTEHLSSITIAYVATIANSRKSKGWKRLRVLLDSGCGATLINKKFVDALPMTKDKKNK